MRKALFRGGGYHLTSIWKSLKTGLRPEVHANICTKSHRTGSQTFQALSETMRKRKLKNPFFIQVRTELASMTPGANCVGALINGFFLQVFLRTNDLFLRLANKQRNFNASVFHLTILRTFISYNFQELFFSDDVVGHQQPNLRVSLVNVTKRSTTCPQTDFDSLSESAKQRADSSKHSSVLN
jgi:hypothetical protein